MNNFKKLLDHFNFMAGTNGKCEGQYQHNFIVSGLDDKEFEDFNTTLKYLPDRCVGVGCISKKRYDDMTTPMSVVLSKGPHYTESWVANLSRDMLDCMSGFLTHGKTYDVIVDENNKYVVLNDSSILKGYHHSWFTPVKLYDEDESELVCRDIEFKDGDYIDLRKLTREQIQHIAKFYKFFNLTRLLEGLPTWVCVYYEYDSFIGTCGTFYTKGREYHFNDIFYHEGEDANV
jgi:hypothetical protein